MRTLSNTTAWSDDAVKFVSKRLELLSKIFFKPLSKEDQIKQERALDDSLLEYLARRHDIAPHIKDFRKMRK